MFIDLKQERQKLASELQACTLKRLIEISHDHLKTECLKEFNKRWCNNYNPQSPNRFLETGKIPINVYYHREKYIGMGSYFPEKTSQYSLTLGTGQGGLGLWIVDLEEKQDPILYFSFDREDGVQVQNPSYVGLSLRVFDEGSPGCPSIILPTPFEMLNKSQKNGFWNSKPIKDLLNSTGL